MGLRGQAPVPTALLEARGSWRAKINPGEPKPTRGKPVCPNRLSKAAKTIWRKLVSMLDAIGVLTVIDGAQLERYCTFFARWRECEDFIAKNGLTYPVKSDDPKGSYVGRLPDGTAIVGFAEYAQVRESHRLDKALKQIEMQFGLTPAARTRISVGDDAPEADPFAEFLKPNEN